MHILQCIVAHILVQMKMKNYYCIGEQNPTIYLMERGVRSWAGSYIELWINV